MSRSLTRWQAILLGLIVSIGFTLGGVGLFTVGSRQWLWGNTFYVRAGFKQIRGVEVGTRVRVQGIEAGEVEDIEAPKTPGHDIVLRLRLDGKVRHLVRVDAAVQIVSEGMIGGKVLEVQPGSESAEPVQDGALLASRPAAELTDMLGEVQAALQDLRKGEGTLGKLVKDPEAYAALLALLRQSQETMASVQNDADALKRLPLVRGYVEDPLALMVRPDCERNRQCFAEEELFEPGRAVLTAAGRQRLDALAPWLTGLKHKGSEVVIASYADPKSLSPAAARTLTKQQSEAVCTYLKGQHAVQKMGWFSSRKVSALGCGTNPPPVPEKDPLPAARVEVLVFVPQEG
jgi:phospholipid/cholesterol/gamma-HCH transport system substrate-binding protein